MHHLYGPAVALLALALAVAPMPAARAADVADVAAPAGDKPYSALAWRLVGPAILRAGELAAFIAAVESAGLPRVIVPGD
jgi:hypothetical protein